jgi:hypothetical protein
MIWYEGTINTIVCCTKLILYSRTIYNNLLAHNAWHVYCKLLKKLHAIFQLRGITA